MNIYENTKLKELKRLIYDIDNEILRDEIIDKLDSFVDYIADNYVEVENKEKLNLLKDKYLYSSLKEYTISDLRPYQTKIFNDILKNVGENKLKEYNLINVFPEINGILLEFKFYNGYDLYIPVYYNSEYNKYDLDPYLYKESNNRGVPLESVSTTDVSLRFIFENIFKLAKQKLKELEKINKI